MNEDRPTPGKIFKVSIIHSASRRPIEVSILRVYRGTKHYTPGRASCDRLRRALQKVKFSGLEFGPYGISAAWYTPEWEKGFGK